MKNYNTKNVRQSRVTPEVRLSEKILNFYSRSQIIDGSLPKSLSKDEIEILQKLYYLNAFGQEVYKGFSIEGIYDKGESLINLRFNQEFYLFEREVEP